jgi:hypothetical protein
MPPPSGTTATLASPFPDEQSLSAGEVYEFLEAEQALRPPASVYRRGDPVSSSDPVAYDNPGRSDR